MRSLKTLCVMAILAALSSLASAQAPRIPVPSAEAIREAEGLVNEVYGNEVTKAATAAAKTQLAKKLLEEGRATNDDKAARYVMFRNARDLGVAGGDLDIVFAAIQQLVKEYAVEQPALEADALTTMAAAATAASSKRLAEAALSAIDEAMARGDFASAVRLGNAGLAAARKAKDPELLKSLTARAAELASVQKAAEQVKEAIALLESDPTNPSANLAVGRFLCFVKGDWDRGLPKLALGSEPALKALAEKEVAGVKGGVEQAKLGDGWWDLGETEDLGLKNKFRLHAASWYRKAQPELTGLALAKVEKRLKDLASLETPAAARPVIQPRLDGSRESIDAGLTWLVKQQQRDGSWSFKTVADPGTQNGTVASTSMALIALLRAGNTPTEGVYKEAVQKGVTHLAKQVKADGDLRDVQSMYVHGLGTIALCEVLVTGQNRKFKGEAQAAVNFIVAAQDPTGGGWRYSPRQPGDTSVVGWQLSALALAKEAKLTVPDGAFTQADRFLTLVQSNSGANYGYTGPGAGPATTAIGLYHRLEKDAAARTPPMAAGIKFIAATGPSRNNYYFNYYATLLMHKAGGEEWNTWKKAVRTRVAEAQDKDKSPQKGSWHIQGQPHGETMGRLGETCFALMILLVD